MSGELRAGRAGRGTARPAGVRGPRRLAAALVAVALLLTGAGCGTDAQTLRPYTPAEGVNFDVPEGAQKIDVVHVRNLLIISKTPGSGVLSAALVTEGRDQLTEITGYAIKADGSQGSPLTVTLTNDISIANEAQVVLTDGTPIGVTGADLVPGLTASLTLTFAEAGDHTVTVPVADGNAPHYATISPAPTPTPSSTPSG